MVANKKKESSLQGTVFYQAEDSMLFDMKTKKVQMYGKSKIKYTDLTIASEQVEINWKENTLDARGVKDTTTGKWKGTPEFSQGAKSYSAKRMKYNFKTKRGVINTVVTKEGEGYIHGDRVKKDVENNMYINSAKYTTCDLAHPHFYFNAHKIKVIPQKRIISGPFNVVIADIPLPIGFLFGYFPVPKKRGSGFVMPVYGESRDRGFFFQNGGYFWAMNEYINLKLLGSIYTLGGGGGQGIVNYKKKYGFQGNASFTFNVKSNEIPNSSQRRLTEDFWFNWSHTPDSKGKSSSLSASVSMGSSGFNRNNAVNPQNLLSSSFQSNVNYSKTFVGTPFNMSVVLSQTQNTLTRQETYNLPNIAFNMNRQSPFKEVRTLKKIDFFKNFNIAYSSQINNRWDNIEATRFSGESKDTLSLFATPFSKISRTATYGMVHRVPIGTTMRFFKYFNFNPSLSYNEVWYPNQLEWSLSGSRGKNGFRPVDTLNQFSRSYWYNTNASVTTRIYGTFYIKRLGIEAIRHQLIPTIGVSYQPDFSEAQYGSFTTFRDSSNRMQVFSRYNGYMMGSAPRGAQGNINYSLSNTFEMKVKSKTDTVKKFAKVSLFESIGISGSYNLLADSFNLSNIIISARTNLFKNMINFSFNGSIDPYSYRFDSLTRRGVVVQKRMKQLEASKIDLTKFTGSFGNLVNANFNLNLTLNPEMFKPAATQKAQSDAEKEMSKLAKMYPDRYVDFKLPWTFRTMYTLNYNKIGFQKENVIQTMQFGGDLRLTDKWKVAFTSNFDIVKGEFSYTTFNIFRDLHCWQLNIMWIPFGPNQMYTIDLNVKSTILKDLKLNKRRADYLDNVQ